MTCVLSLEAHYDLGIVLGGSLWLVFFPWRLTMTCVLFLEALYACVLSLVTRYTLALDSRGTCYALSSYNKDLVCSLWVMYYMVLHLSFGLGFLEKDLIKTCLDIYL